MINLLSKKNNNMEHKNISLEESIKAGLMGFFVGDALGVPVEFIGRSSLKDNPVTDMIGYGTHYQPKGTWSDDSSMVLGTMEALINNINNIDYIRMMNNFLKWKKSGEFTPFDKVFDIGNSTSCALSIYDERKKENKEENFMCGNGDISSNGNGSLMRILPISFYLYAHEIDYNSKEYFDVISKISSMTHSHSYSILGCFIYSVFVTELIKTHNKFVAYENLQQILKKIEINDLSVYSNIIDKDIYKFKEKDIKSSGYVVDSLEASIWCLMNTNDYRTATLKAVNLGDDTDTIGALTGALAGILYGFNDIPRSWIDELQKREYLIDITNNFVSTLVNSER